MADVEIKDPQSALNDANLLIASAADMVSDWNAKKSQIDTELANAKGVAREAFDRAVTEYAMAFDRLAATYDDLGRKVVKVIQDTLDADQEAKLIWDRMSNSSGAITR
jgi:hypothetical protein